MERKRVLYLSLGSNEDCQARGRASDASAEEVMGGRGEMLVLEKRERSDPVVDKVSGVLGNPAG